MRLEKWEEERGLREPKLGADSKRYELRAAGAGFVPQLYRRDPKPGADASSAAESAQIVH